MEDFSTEEQQVQAIKDWWKKNGTSVIVGSVVGLAAVFGWRYFSEYQITQQEAASDAYQMAVNQLQMADDSSALQAYVSAHQGDDNYGVMAAMLLAKSLVSEGQYQQALEQLEWASKYAPKEMSDFITLRIARVKAQLQDFDGALNALSQIKDASFTAHLESVRGDVYLAQGDKLKARQAYQAALAAGAASSDPTVQIKLDDLTEGNNG